MQSKPATPEKLIAIVLGFHRSGTSLLAAGLESLDAYLALKHRNSSDENPKGFFENEEIVYFNDRLLEFLGGHWDNPLFDGRQAIGMKAPADLSPWLDEAEEIILSNFDGQAFSAIKDPRICHLLPFWEQVLSRCGYNEDNTYYIHIARHPMEIAQSQHNRKQANSGFYCIGDNMLETVSLWFSLSYQALRDINSDNNIFLLYTDLLDKPKNQLVRLAGFLGVDYSEKKMDDFCNLFVDKTLRKNIVGSEESRILKEKFPEAMQFFKEQKLLALKKAFSRLDAQKALNIWQQPDAQKHRLEPITPLFSKLATERLSLNFRISQVTGERDQLQKDLNLIRSELEEVTGERDQLQKDLNLIRSELEEVMKR